MKVNSYLSTLLIVGLLVACNMDFENEDPEWPKLMTATGIVNLALSVEAINGGRTTEFIFTYGGEEKMIYSAGTSVKIEVEAFGDKVYNELKAVVWCRLISVEKL